MGGLGQLVNALVGLTEGLVPHWVWPAGLLVLAALAWPSVRRNTRTDQARKAFRTATRLGHDARLAQEDAAVDLVADHAEGLVALADLALAEGRPRVVPHIVARLRALGARPEHVRRLEAVLAGPQPQTALEAAIIVERLWEQGQAEEAVRRLERARARFPDDADLAALAARVAPPG